MRNFIAFAVFVAWVLVFGGSSTCSPSWCAYEELKRESMWAKDDYAILANISFRIETAIKHARASGSRAVYALELLLANNLMRLDMAEDAAVHYENSYSAADPEKRYRIGIALWNAKKTAADSILRACKDSCTKDDFVRAGTIYRWLQARKELVPTDWYEKVAGDIDIGIRRTQRKQ